MFKTIVTAAALAAFAFCAPASASAQQGICNRGTLPPGYTSHDVREMCGDRKVAGENKQVRTAGNTFIAPRINLGLNNQRRPGYRGGYRNDQDWSDEDDSRLNEMLARKSQHVLQGIPTKRNHRGFIGEQDGPIPLRPGCHEVKRQSGGEMFVRRICD